MNFWLLAALGMIVALLPCGIVCFRGSPIDRLVGLEMADTICTLIMLLLAEGFHRLPFYDLGVALALLAFGSGLVFVRFLERYFMSHPLAAAILLGVAVAVTFISTVGVLAMRDAYQRVHYLGPVASISGVCVAAAVLITEGLNQAGIKALLVAAILVVMNAVLSHATVRAARIRQFGEWRPQQGERVVEQRGEQEPLS